MLVGWALKGQIMPPTYQLSTMEFQCPQSGPSLLKNPSSFIITLRISISPLQTMRGMKKLLGFKKVSAWKYWKGTQMVGGTARSWTVGNHLKAGCPQIIWRKKNRNAMYLNSLIYTSLLCTFGRREKIPRCISFCSVVYAQDISVVLVQKVSHLLGCFEGMVSFCKYRENTAGINALSFSFFPQLMCIRVHYPIT